MERVTLDHFPASGDDGDMSLVASENDLKLALYRRKIDAKNSEMVFTGFCAYCSAPIDRGNFCAAEEDFSCRDEYQKIKDAEKRNGRV
jgi:hypothetical protein